MYQEKDLGVIIDSELTFEAHIFSKIKKANSIVGLIGRSFDYLSPEMFRTLFIAFVRPHLEYVQAVWSPSTLTIESVQRRATRLISGYKNRSYEDRLCIIKLPSLKIRRRISDMAEVYKHLHVKSSASQKLFLHNRPQRQHDYELQRNFADDGVRGYQTNSLYYRSVDQWNKLTDNIVDAPTVGEFKEELLEQWKKELYKL